MLKAVVALALAPLALAATPSGTYTGTAKVGFLSVTETAVANDDSTLDLAVSGAFSFECKGEAYTLDDAGAITVTNLATDGDCLHDALAANHLTFESATYDAAADAVTLVVSALGVDVSSVLSHVAALRAGAAPSGVYKGTVTELGETFDATMTADAAASTFELVIAGAISMDCADEAYTYASGVVTVIGASTDGDCVHDTLGEYRATLGAVAYDEAKDQLTVAVAVGFIKVNMVLAKATLRGGALREWAAFKAEFNKRYPTAEEDAQRRDIFLDNLDALDARVHALGAAEGGVFGVTKFFDQTAAEFRRSHLNYKPVKPVAHIPVLNLTGAPAPRSAVNWLDAGAATPVKDQGYCGSCWAFSAVEQVESAWKLAGNPLTTFSTQQLVSCDTGGDDGGCQGGDSPTAYEYIKGAGGLASDEAYPYSKATYNGADGTCKSFTTVGGAVQSWSYVTPACTTRKCNNQDEDTLQKGIDAAPASICVNAESWQSYTGGVMTSSTCGKNGYYALDHCVQLIGYNADASTPYWIVRNSWAEDWGENGMIYLKMGENTCGVAVEAMTVSF